MNNIIIIKKLIEMILPNIDFYFSSLLTSKLILVPKISKKIIFYLKNSNIIFIYLYFNLYIPLILNK